MSRILLLTVGLSLVLGFATAEPVRYENYNVYQVIPETQEAVELLQKFEETSDSLIFIQGATIPGREVTVVVAPHKEPDFVLILNDNKIKNEMVEKNLQRSLDEEAHSFNRRAAGYDWTSYHSLDETYTFLESLAARFPGIVEVVDAGRTYEGRSIKGVKVSFKSGNKGIFIEGGIHAREWIGPATVTYMLNELLTSTDSSVRAMAEKYDWYVFPHANPDGYVYTQNKERLWRKTRSKGTLCYGADPNRNWAFHWREVGASSSQCSDTYAGSKAFSEIETQTLSDYIASLKGKISIYLSYHSFSQLLLFPHGHTKTHVPNHNDLQRIGEASAAALAKRYGTKFTVGNVYEAIYPAAGASIDWVYGVLDVKLAYTYELRPKSSASNGFVLPANQIIPTAMETLDGLVGLVAEAEKLGY